MKKLFLLSLSLLFLPQLVLAQADIKQEKVFEARVLEVLEEKKIDRPDESQVVQQNLKLRGLSGEFEDREFEYWGVSDLQVLSSNVFKTGDKVLVSVVENSDGQVEFYVLDYVRRGWLIFLTLVFALLVVLIGRATGLRALLSLGLSFVVIMYFIIPRILSGGNAVLTSIVGGFVIMGLIVYLTEGWRRKTHLAVLSIGISLIAVVLLSLFFTWVVKLTGLSQDDAIYLSGIAGRAINFRGLLLAGILIGTLGALDDVIIAQIEAVEKIREANPNLSKPQIFKLSFGVGKAHLGAMVNTLFLAYAGASLPLLLLFSSEQNRYLGFSQVVNSEVVATEVVRTLVGSVGITLAIPIATWLAVYALKYESIKTPEH